MAVVDFSGTDILYCSDSRRGDTRVVKTLGQLLLTAPDTNQAPQAGIPCWGRAHCSMDICLDSGCFLAMQSLTAMASRWPKLFRISETYIYPKLRIDTDPVCAYSFSDFKSSVPSISYPRLPWFS